MEGAKGATANFTRENVMKQISYLFVRCMYYSISNFLTIYRRIFSTYCRTARHSQPRAVLRIRTRCLFDPLDPGSGIVFSRIPDLGYQTHIFESLLKIFVNWFKFKTTSTVLRSLFVWIRINIIEIRTKSKNPYPFKLNAATKQTGGHRLQRRTIHCTLYPPTRQ